MARYTGPKTKVSRRYGVPLFGPSKSLERRNFPPGQHGAKNTRKKQSDFSIALAEKQKLKIQYGLLERQFHKYFVEAARRRGVTGTILLQILETRLDNVVYRLGFANSRASARQFVGHCHVLVNGQQVNVSNYICKPGDRIAVKEAPRSQQLATRMTEPTQSHVVPDWVTVDTAKLTGMVARLPERDEIDPMVNEQLVVELYSR